MLTQPTKLWLCTASTDMRKQVDGLVALAKHHLGHDPLSGHGFVFVNRRRTHMKLLYFDRDGFCIWSKRLEQGQFGVRHGQQPESVALSRTEFEALLEGLDLEILIKGVKDGRYRTDRQHDRSSLEPAFAGVFTL